MELKNPAKKYNTTKSLVYSCQYHVIFCTKYRRKVLTDGIDTRFKELVLEKQPEYHYELLEMEVMPDHVHLLLDVSPLDGINKIVGQIKGYTANRLRKEFPTLVSRIPSLWTRSRLISTVGAVSLDVVKRYIEGQKGK